MYKMSEQKWIKKHFDYPNLAVPCFVFSGNGTKVVYHVSLTFGQNI